MRTYMRLIGLMVVVVLLGATTLGCNTFKGAGKDIQKGGAAVEDAASGAQR